MISEKKLREFLHDNVPEGQTVDFKREMHYPFSKDKDGNNIAPSAKEEAQSKFIKDIIAMANTERDEAAYIIIGVEHHVGTGVKDLVGVLKHPDDAELQQSLNPAKIAPRSPTFSYQAMRLDGLSYGIIEIPIKDDGPYWTTVNYGDKILVKDEIYFRKGSENETASPHERTQINEWFIRRRFAAKSASSSQQNIYHGAVTINGQNNITGGSPQITQNFGNVMKRD